LLVKTKIGPSTIHGIGIFADEFIPKGTNIWRLAPGLDIELTAEQAEILPEAVKGQFFNYSYFDTIRQKYILCWDDARFFNHSKTPNTINYGSADSSCDVTVATKDIQIGEEIVSDYGEFD